MRYWISTISRSDVQAGMAAGFMEADARRERVREGDFVVFYSPREDVRAGAPVQRFTAVAEVLDDAGASRRNVRYLACGEVAVQTLIDRLAFIRNKKSWGVAFRRGFFEITHADFEIITAAMNHAFDPLEQAG